MKASQPMSITIRQIEFELEKAEHGMALPYDAERVAQVAQHATGRAQAEAVRRAKGETGKAPPMTTLTMRYSKGHFIVTGPDVPRMRFKSRPEARDWCKAHYPGSPITEIGRAASRRAVAMPRARPRKASDAPKRPRSAG